MWMVKEMFARQKWLEAAEREKDKIIFIDSGKKRGDIYFFNDFFICFCVLMICDLYTNIY